MPNKRHRTTIEIDVDDRKLRGLDKSIAKAFNDEALRSFADRIARLSRNLVGLTSAFDKTGQAARRSGGPARDSRGRYIGGGGGAGVAGGGGGRADALLEQLVTGQNRRFGQRMLGFANRGLGRAGGVGAGMVNESAVATAVGAIPWVGQIGTAAIQQARALYGDHVGQQAAFASAFGQAGSALKGGVRGFGRFGMDAGQAATALGGLAGQTGLRGGALTSELALGLQGAESFAGIRGAGLINALNVGSNSTRNGMDSVHEAVGAGIVAGIREARLGDYVQTIASEVEQARRNGIDLNPQSLNAMTVGLSGLGRGFVGEQAQAFTQSVSQAMRSFTPSGNAGSLIALRAAGFGRGSTSYYEARQAIETGNTEVFARILRNVRGMSGGSTEHTMYLLEQILRQMGIRGLSVERLRSLAEGDLSSLEEGTSGLGMAGEAYLGEQAEGGREAFGTSAAEAGYRNQRAGAGAGVAGQVRRIRRLDMRVMNATLGPTLSAVGGLVSEAVDLLQAFQEGGFEGAFDHVVDRLMTGIRELADEFRERVANPLDEAEERYREAREEQRQLHFAQALRGGASVPEDSHEGAPHVPPNSRRGRQVRRMLLMEAGLSGEEADFAINNPQIFRGTDIDVYNTPEDARRYLAVYLRRATDAAEQLAAEPDGEVQSR